MGFIESLKDKIAKSTDKVEKTGEKSPEKTGAKSPEKTGVKGPEIAEGKKEKLNPWGGKAGTWEVPALKKPGAMEAKMSEIRKKNGESNPDSTSETKGETRGERERDLPSERRRVEKSHDHGTR